MSAEFVAAVVDALLPGEATAPGGEGIPLPPASRAGIDLPAIAAAHAAGFAAIAAGSGGEVRFLAAGAAERRDAIAAVEVAAAKLFRPLLTDVLAAYWEAPSVLAAMGWPDRPPQPDGHTVAPTDEATWARLERVRQRGRIWR